MGAAALYFAYGSNMKSGRLQARVPSAAAHGIAGLAGFCFAMNKRGKDGSAKANICIAPGERVYGVAFSFDEDHWDTLDRFETGYDRVGVEVELAGDLREAVAYVCTDPSFLTEDPVPFGWYRQLMIDGCLEHRLPESHRKMLEAWPCKPDPEGRAPKGR